MKTQTVATLIFFLFTSSLAQAGLDHWSGGLNLVSFAYKEDLTGAAKSNETGILPVFELGLNGTASGLSWDLAGRFMWGGATQYDGTELSSGDPITATDTHNFYEAEGSLRYPLAMGWSVLAGLRYKIWDRFLAYGSGYREIYSWLNLPVGVRWDFHPAAAAEFTLQPMMVGNIRVIFSETHSTGDDTDLTLGNRMGYRLRVPIVVLDEKPRRWRLTPWYEYSEIGESNAVYNDTPGIKAAIREPSSTTHQLGILLSIEQAL